MLTFYTQIFSLEKQDMFVYMCVFLLIFSVLISLKASPSLMAYSILTLLIGLFHLHNASPD